MAAALRVKRAKGGDGAPAIGQVTRVGVRKRNRGGTKVKSGTRKYSCEVAPKAGAVPVKE